MMERSLRSRDGRKEMILRQLPNGVQIEVRPTQLSLLEDVIREIRDDVAKSTAETLEAAKSISQRQAASDERPLTIAEWLKKYGVPQTGQGCSSYG